MSTYNFPQSKVEDAVAIIEKVNRKAAKAGIAERIEFVTSDYMVKGIEDGVVTFDEWCELILTVPMVKVNGWAFVATLTWDAEAGLVTRVVPGQVLEVRPETCHCDVCNKSRNRIDTYVMVNEVTNEQIQVGSGCLERFFGFTPKGLEFMDFESKLRETEDDFRTFRGEHRFSVVQVVALTLAVVKELGWTSRSAAEQSYVISTSQRVSQIVNKFDDSWRQWFVKAEAFTAEAQNVVKMVSAIEGTSEYANNLRNVITCETVSIRNLGLLCSAYAAYKRMIEEAATVGISKHFGKVGEKVNFAATVTDTRLMEGAYGFTTLISFVTADGNVAKWFASGEHEYANGTKVMVKGTVKENSVYNNVKQTMLTRCKIA